MCIFCTGAFARFASRLHARRPASPPPVKTESAPGKPAAKAQRDKRPAAPRKKP
jgi:hypothetical protein